MSQMSFMPDLKTNLGANLDNEGKKVNFSLYSKNATMVILCIFDEAKGQDPLMNLVMKKQEGKDIWETSVKTYALKDLKEPFFYGYTDFGHFSRQKTLGFGHTVLGVDGSHVGVCTLLEVNSDASRTVVGGGRGHVGHVFYTVDGFFQWDNDTLLYGFGIGTCIAGRYRYGRWCDVGILFHRQIEQADEAQHQYQN